MDDSQDQGVSGEDLASELWPKMNTGQGSSAPPAESFQSKAGELSNDTQRPLGGIYRENNEGDPPSTYEPVLRSFFDGKEHAARFEKDQLQIEALEATRTGVNEVLRSFEVGETGAKEILDLFNEYMDNPLPEEAIEAEKSKTADALKKEWGHDMDKMVGAAKRVLQEAAKRIPNLMETVNQTGIGNDINFIRRLAFIGKRRGFAK